MATIAQQLEQPGREDGLKPGYYLGYQLGFQQGFQLGFERGIRKGERQVALKIARGLLQRGAEYQFITDGRYTRRFSANRPYW